VKALESPFRHGGGGRERSLAPAKATGPGERNSPAQIVTSNRYKADSLHYRATQVVNLCKPRLCELTVMISR